jgi:hypothetical protein
MTCRSPESVICDSYIDACFACRRRLPIAIRDSVVRRIERVDPTGIDAL